ncbi:AbrB/MazE/SpoVT family DNA-binding domain-containing protein [Candidatus Woesearchaeota archaeon]|nr:AbrB/MazE/SpoVT family DNA-binding domain-containing protein [Candidatus Woesearchaeota archaeon]
MEASVKAKRIGGSLGVIIPKEIVKRERILEEDTLNIRVEKTDNLNFLWEKYRDIKTPTDQIMREIDENEAP